MIVKITSCAPVLAFRKPTNAPKSAAPTIPAIRATTMCSTKGSSSLVATNVANIIPKISCPVPPILNRPTRKVSPMPSPAAISGAPKRRVSVSGLIAFSNVSASAL